MWGIRMIGIYARQSNEDASRYSISSQIEANRAKAAILYPNVPTKEYVDDGYSGEFLDRPALTQLRQDVREGIITHIVCFDPDRLSRKLMNQLILTDEFERKRVEVVFVNGEYAKTPEGNLFYSMRGAISEFEKAKINERMSRGRIQKAKDGKVIKDCYTYGYVVKNGQFEVIQEEAEVVQLVFDLFTTPNAIVRGMNGIALYLQRNGIKTKKGKNIWHRQTVRQILMNETYIGVFYQNKWNTEGMLGNKYRSEKVRMKKRPQKDWIATPCPAIIPEAQFHKAQQLINESKRRFAKMPKNQYLLSGMLRCGECGNTMNGRKSLNWGKHVFEYTCKKNTVGAKNKGCGKMVNRDRLESEVWNTFMHWLNQPDKIEVQEEKPVEYKELTMIETRLEKLQSERKRLLQLFKSNLDIGEELIREEFQNLKKQEEYLQEEKAKVEKKLTQSQSQESTKELIVEALEYFSSIEELTFEHKQNLLRHVVKEVRHSADHIEIVTF
jgi:site-specific DNA recombinase